VGAGVPFSQSDAVLWGIKDTLQLLPRVNRATLRRLVEYWALVLQYEHINRMNIAVRLRGHSPR
jgi:hypothetical protein